MCILSVLTPRVSHAQETSLSTFLKAEHPGGPVNMTGKNFVYDYKTDSFIVTGDAVITQAKTTLTADKVNLMRRDRKMHAVGNVHLKDPVGNIIATDAVVNLNDETSDLTNATVTDRDETYRLEGRKVYKLLGQRYKVLDGFFTTCGCEPGTPDWSITAEDMDVHIGESGHAHNAHFNILGYPVIPMPYATFPADAESPFGTASAADWRVGPARLPDGATLLLGNQQEFGRDRRDGCRDFEARGALGEYRLISGIDDFFTVDGAFYNEDLRSASSRVTDVSRQPDRRPAYSDRSLRHHRDVSPAHHR